MHISDEFGSQTNLYPFKFRSFYNNDDKRKMSANI